MVEVEEVPQPVEGIRTCLERGLPGAEGDAALRVHHGELLGGKMVLKVQSQSVTPYPARPQDLSHLTSTCFLNPSSFRASNLWEQIGQVLVVARCASTWNSRSRMLFS